MRPAGQRPDPRHQNSKLKRLGQVVISAKPKTLHEIVIARRRRQHQHPAPALAIEKPRTHLIAVQPWQVAVEHDHLVLIQERAL